MGGGRIETFSACWTPRWRADLVVGVVALRPLRPRRAGGPGHYGPLGAEDCAPLCAARRLAARAVPPCARRDGSQREPFHHARGATARSASRSTVRALACRVNAPPLS